MPQLPFGRTLSRWIGFSCSPPRMFRCRIRVVSYFIRNVPTKCLFTSLNGCLRPMSMVRC